MADNNAEHARYCLQIAEYLGSKFGDKIKERITKKIASKLGVASFGAMLTGNFPAAKLAKFASSWMLAMKFEGDLISYGARQGNGYDPQTRESAYVEYLLFSWGRLGKPGYIYEDLKDYYPGRKK